MKRKRKKMSPLLIAGLTIFAIYMIIEKLVTPITVWIAVPVLVAVVILIIVGGYKTKELRKEL